MTDPTGSAVPLTMSADDEAYGRELAPKAYALVPTIRQETNGYALVVHSREDLRVFLGMQAALVNAYRELDATRAALAEARAKVEQEECAQVRGPLAALERAATHLLDVAHHGGRDWTATADLAEALKAARRALSATTPPSEAAPDAQGGGR